jgi:hypothetical protein
VLEVSREVVLQIRNLGALHMAMLAMSPPCVNGCHALPRRGLLRITCARSGPHGPKGLEANLALDRLSCSRFVGNQFRLLPTRAACIVPGLRDDRPRRRGTTPGHRLERSTPRRPRSALRPALVNPGVPCAPPNCVPSPP